MDESSFETIAGAVVIIGLDRLSVGVCTQIWVQGDNTAGSKLSVWSSLSPMQPDQSSQLFSDAQFVTKQINRDNEVRDIETMKYLKELVRLTYYIRISNAKNARADALSKLVPAPAFKLSEYLQLKALSSFMKGEVEKTWVDKMGAYLNRGNYQMIRREHEKP